MNVSFWNVLLQVVIFWLFSDGITSPGILCVVSYAIQDAIKEKSVNLFQTVRQFHIKNPEFIASQVVYFCKDIYWGEKKYIAQYQKSLFHKGSFGLII